MNQIITKEVQEVIDYVLKHESDLNFKVCKTCGRSLPAHEWFYTKHEGCKFGVLSKCKECVNKGYVFYDLIHPWYNTDEEFIINFRKMSIEQLVKYYNKSSSTITVYAKTLKLNKPEINTQLTEEEIIFMYESLLNNEIKVFTNGIYNYDKYIVILIKYMINNILKWDREDICQNYSSKIYKKNGLSGMLGIEKFSIYEYLIKSFPEYDINPWELRSSSVGNGFWTEENVNKSLNWLKIKLLEYKNIDNINFAGTFGFNNLLEKYNLLGLCSVRFNASFVALFEKMYGEKFSKEEMLKHNYKFDINTDCNSISAESKIYKLTDSYYDLDDRGKTLINEIVRFCNNEGRFPTEKWIYC